MWRRPPRRRSLRTAAPIPGTARTASRTSSRPLPLTTSLRADVRAVWDDAVAAPAWEGPPVWVHGDLHPANVVVSDGTLSGIVDFGDMFAGDPAWDLAAAWVLLPAGTASRFFDMYAQADEAAIRRARGLAAMKSLFLMLMGQNGDRGLPGGKPNWGPAGRAALDRALSERLTRSASLTC